MIEEFFLSSTLLQSGGLVLGLIVVLSTLMWGIILERYWFFRRELPQLIEICFAQQLAERNDRGIILVKLGHGGAVGVVAFD